MATNAKERMRREKENGEGSCATGRAPTTSPANINCVIIWEKISKPSKKVCLLPSHQCHVLFKIISPIIWEGWVYLEVYAPVVRSQPRNQPGKISFFQKKLLLWILFDLVVCHRFHSPGCVFSLQINPKGGLQRVLDWKKNHIKSKCKQRVFSILLVESLIQRFFF